MQKMALREFARQVLQRLRLNAGCESLPAGPEWATGAAQKDRANRRGECACNDRAQLPLDYFHKSCNRLLEVI